MFCHNEGQARDGTCFLTLDRFRLVASAGYAAGVRHFQFSGGEPILNSLLPQMVAVARRLGPEVTTGITTNGTLVTEAHLGWFAQTMSNVRVGLPSLSPKRFEAITGFSGASKVVEMIRQMARAKVPVGINVVYYDQYPQEIFDLIHFAGEVGCDLKVLEWVSESYAEVRRKSDELAAELAQASSEPVQTHASVDSFTIRAHDGHVRVRLVRSPCVNRNADACRERGEIRLRADGAVEGCVDPRQRSRETNQRSVRDAAIAQIERAAKEIIRCPS
jgi:molybdenum cofactor biosynthesis enzyme MoaA